MTPTELDAIFRAWRDDWFAKNPEATEWRGNYLLFRDELAPYLSEHDKEVKFNHLLEASKGELRKGPNWEVIIYRAGYTFSFPDPPPLPASAPIPFPAGKALLEIINHSGGEGDIILV